MPTFNRHPQPYTPFKPTEKQAGDLVLTAKGWVIVEKKKCSK